ncbi:hypothetical protein PIROE2DRAFT_44673 [Piromyces sp. E2]|nr:hypothetical protein PIROE2DRAFT_44673 [Piromyces sp. E2]|eukprot:OUM62070.1 hypothetical protein PIROE2DRAFT_44673 [Piromyces sp. E2]
MYIYLYQYKIIILNCNNSICSGDNTKDKKCLPRCGIINNEIVKCSNKDDCCSSEGYCGTDDKFCFASKGCQPQYGICKCGENFDNGACSGGYCCSKQGFCGTTSKFCATSNCQINYGFCAQNNYTCEDDQCCSSEGYCGTDDKFCFASKGCQPQYGICKCGSKFDNGGCSGGYCCSNQGYCGATSEFCATRCQPQYGICKCGGKFDNGACSGGYCCSNQGYCGTTSEFCATSNCQIKYGFCAQNNYTCKDVKAKFIPEDGEVVDCKENDDGYVKSL